MVRLDGVKLYDLRGVKSSKSDRHHEQFEFKTHKDTFWGPMLIRLSSYKFRAFVVVCKVFFSPKPMRSGGSMVSNIGLRAPEEARGGARHMDP